MKLSQRTLITPPLADASFFHLVQGGSSWKTTLSQLFDYIFATKNPIVIEFTGTLRSPIVLLMAYPPPAILPFGTAAGTYTIKPDTTLFPCVFDFKVGGAAGLPGLLTISFHGVKSCLQQGVGTDTFLTSVDFPDLVYCSGGFSGGNSTSITSFTANNMIFAGAFNPGIMPALTTLSFPELVYVGSWNTFGPNTLAGLTTWNFPKLKSMSCQFVPSTFAILTNLSCPALEACGNFAPTTMALLTTLSFPVLAEVGNFAPTTMAALTTISFPSLAQVGGPFSVASMAALTTLSFPAMVNYASTITVPSATCANVASVTLGTVGTLKSILGATITLSGLKLPSANVNAVLALLVSLDGTNGTTLWGSGKTLNISGGTNGAPTGQGITDKATLVARGATVTTN